MKDFLKQIDNFSVLIFDNESVFNLILDDIHTITNEKNISLRRKCWQQILDKIGMGYDSYSEPLPFLAVVEIEQFNRQELKDHIIKLKDSYTKEEVEWWKLLYLIVKFFLQVNEKTRNNLTILKEKEYVFLNQNLELICLHVFYMPNINKYIVYNTNTKKLFKDQHDDLSTISKEEIEIELSSLDSII